MYGLVATLMILAGVLAIGSLADDDALPGGSGPTPTPVPTPMPSSGALEPGTYVISTLDPDFDASHRITIDVPDGYQSVGGFAATKLGANQTGVSTWLVGNVYADGCDWIGALIDPPPVPSVDDLAVALASQRGLRASTPADVTMDGLAGKYLERTVPAGTNLADCDGGDFRAWLDPTGGLRYLEPGQRDLLWILDVDGVPLVIDAALDSGTSARPEPSSSRWWSPSGSNLDEAAGARGPVRGPKLSGS